MDLAVGVSTSEDLLVEYHISIRLEDLHPGAATKTLPAKDLIGSVKPDVPTGYMDLSVSVPRAEDLLVKYHCAIKPENLHPGVTSKSMPADDVIIHVIVNIASSHIDISLGVGSTEDLSVEYHASTKFVDLHPGASTSTLSTDYVIHTITIHIPTGYMDLALGVSTSEDLFIEYHRAIKFKYLHPGGSTSALPAYYFISSIPINIPSPDMDFTVGIATSKDLPVEYHRAIRIVNLHPGAPTVAVSKDALLLAITIYILRSHIDLAIGITITEDPVVYHPGISYGVPDTYPGVSPLPMSHAYGTTTKDQIGLPGLRACRGAGVSMIGTDDYIVIPITVYIPAGNRPARPITSIIPVDGDIG